MVALLVAGCLAKSTVAPPDGSRPIDDAAIDASLPDPQPIDSGAAGSGGGFVPDSAVDDGANMQTDGHIDVPDAPDEPVGGWTDGHAIDIGADHTCALKGDGAVFCWGNNFNGQAGCRPDTGLCTVSTGFTSCIETPAPVVAPPGSKWIRISAGHTHACGILDDDHLYCWGSNRVGQLGNGMHDASYDGWSPIVEAPLTHITDVAAGEEHTCAIAGGAMYCWGRNDDGELGSAPAPDDCNGDSCALSPSRVDEHTDWTAVSAAGQITCGIRGGAIYCWGFSANNQRDPNCEQQCSAPMVVQIGTDTDWIAVNTWASRSCAIKTNHTLWCWGQDEAYESRHVDPVQVDVDGKDVAQVAPGEDHTCAVTSDGGLYCWGSHDSGQIGTGDHPLESCRYSPCARKPLRIGHGYAMVTVGYQHSCAIKTNGTALCWGNNTHGELGAPTHETCTNGLCATRPILVSDPVL